MTECGSCGREHDRDGGLCFACHVKGIRFAFKGSAQPGRRGWNKTANDFKLENFGTTSEKELADRGIVRADKF